LFHYTAIDFPWRTQSESVRLPFVSQIVTEIRKGAILIAASILAARKIAACEGRPSPAFESAIADAIATAEKILARIERRPSVTGTNRLE